jgi:hypothetical protein
MVIMTGILFGSVSTLGGGGAGMLLYAASRGVETPRDPSTFGTSYNRPWQEVLVPAKTPLRSRHLLRFALSGSRSAR